MFLSSVECLLYPLSSCVVGQRRSSTSTQRTNTNTSLNNSLSDSGYGSSGQTRSYSTQSSTFHTQISQRPHPNQRTNESYSNTLSTLNNSRQSKGFGSPSTLNRADQNENMRYSRGTGSMESNSRVPLLPVQPFSRGTSGGVQSEDSVVCNCGEDGVLLTVRKEGPNTGLLLTSTFKIIRFSIMVL